MQAPQAAPPERYVPARAKAGRLYARLHEDIMIGRLPPGQALSENLLAEEYRISRTPVREVFQRLIADGLLRVVPQVGSFVAPINLAAVADSQFVREALECQAVRRAAGAMTPLHTARLRAQLATQQQHVAAGDQRGFFALDEAMHRAILEIAGHGTVWQVIAGVKAQLDRVRHLSLEDAGWLAMVFSQHQDIVDRLAAQDADGAGEAMQAHLRTVFSAAARIAETHAAFFESPTPEPEAHAPAGPAARVARA